MKRVFTQNKDISFIDYNNFLKSNVLLKNSLSHGRNYKNRYLTIRDDEFINFANYATFFDISKGYFRRFVDTPHCESPFTVYEGKKSAVLNENPNPPYNICLTNKPDLYPYGKYVNKKETFAFLTPLIIPDDRCSNICNRPIIDDYCKTVEL